MKARTRKTPWLLITLLVGFLAAAGVTLVLHPHPGRLLVSASDIAPPDDTPVQHTDTTAPASIGDEQSAEIPGGARGNHYVAAGTYSNSTQTDTAHDSNPPSTASSGSSSSAGTNQPADSTVEPSGGTQPQTHSPSSASDTTTPQQVPGTGDFANGGYMPFDCGVPAGCGGGGSKAVQSSDTSGGTPSLHNSQGSGQSETSDPQTDNANPPTDNSDPTGQGSPGQKSDPSNPGSGQSVAAAPELDPTTLAGGLTLLLGALAIVRSRRVRATIR
jgi:hypothetical protein